MSARFAAALAAMLASCTTAADTAAPQSDPRPAQLAWGQQCEDFDDWDKPGPPFRIHGQTFYVGTCGISSLLVAGKDSHVLIDSGTDGGAGVVLANIRALGFDPRDVTTILMSHEHFDHVGGMGRLQKATGATIVATSVAAAVLRTGKPSPGDPQAGSDHPPFPPVTGPIEELGKFGPARFGGTAFTAIATPGHTLGATSWSWRECEAGGRCATIVYADSMNPISDDRFRFSDRPALVAAFRKGIASVAAADCDIVLAPHPGGVDLRKRLSSEKALVDTGGCKAYADGVAGRLDARLAKERNGG